MTGVNMFNGFPESYSAKTLIGNADLESGSIQIFHRDIDPNSMGYAARCKRNRSQIRGVGAALPIRKGDHVLPHM